MLKHYDTKLVERRETILTTDCAALMFRVFSAIPLVFNEVS